MISETPTMQTTELSLQSNRRRSQRGQHDERKNLVELRKETEKKNKPGAEVKATMQALRPRINTTENGVSEMEGWEQRKKSHCRKKDEMTVVE